MCWAPLAILHFVAEHLGHPRVGVEDVAEEVDHPEPIEGRLDDGPVHVAHEMGRDAAAQLRESVGADQVAARSGGHRPVGAGNVVVCPDLGE